MDFFTAKHFESLYPLMSAFSLVTYDYSNIERPGANSPIKWIRETVEHICPETLPNYREKRQKLLIGMNMYGMDYTLAGGGPITGRQFLDLLKLYKGSLNHAEADEENYFEFKWVFPLFCFQHVFLFEFFPPQKTEQALGILSNIVFNQKAYRIGKGTKHWLSFMGIGPRTGLFLRSFLNPA